ncbi:MAG: plastocyanin/azurin family copper-binding protein [Opitutaceae bacterium]
MRSLFLFLGALLFAGTTGSAAEVIRIGTLPGLRFDTSAFSVRPGAEVEVIFSNSDEMLHNFVVVKPGTRAEVVQAAIDLGAGAADRDFVPPSPNVLWASKVVPSGQSFTLKFTAPRILGDYPYVCTFPGHGIIMFGTMTVTTIPRPPVMNPKELPVDPAIAARLAMDHSAHRASNTASVNRFFMPQAGPASIAVVLPGGYSYCWDAGAGRFRYAWKGTLGARPDKTVAKLEGEVYYREESGFPLRVGPDPAAVPKQIDFNGYTVDAQGIPEFELNVDGVTVRERVEIKDGRITRRFRTNGLSVWFFVSPENQERFTATGPKEGAFYKFTGAAAQDFTVTYTPLPN